MAIKTDALIVGAGPCGLFQVFELGLLGLHAEVVETMPVVGGQCAELYPDKPIYDIPAIPVCSAAQLVERLMEQIKPFDPGFHLGEEVTELSGDGPFRVRTSAGKEFEARTVFIAGGVGSFQPRELRVEGVEELVDEHVFYRVREPGRFAGKRIVVLGAGDSALDWVLELIDSAAEMTLVHRSDQFRAAPASVSRMRELVAAGRMQLIEFGNVTQIETAGDELKALTVTVKDDGERRVEADDLLIFFGLAPKLGPIAEWGLDINRKTINVDTEKFETNIPGIYAIGDINHYPGKKKLILSGFHEAALAAFAAKAFIEPEKKVHLQYTTTSPIMHKRLGVED
ncbi:MAG: NAD(P)/FAD-dependent oxidoreductase [Gammaproteobacteria bacterium]